MIKLNIPMISELEISAVVTNNSTTLEVLEKRKSFADMKMVKVTNLQSIEVLSAKSFISERIIFLCKKWNVFL